MYNSSFPANINGGDVLPLKKQLRFESQQILKQNNNLDLDAYIPLMDDFKKY